MTAEDLLREARLLVKAGWCQGDLAMDATGAACDPMSVRAVKWCALGALDRAAFDDHDDMYLDAVSTLRKIATAGVDWFNDSHDFDDVVELFDMAIDQAAMEEL